MQQQGRTIMIDARSPSFKSSSEDNSTNAEQVLIGLVLDKQRIVKTNQYGNPVYIVSDIELVKQIFEDGQNFSFSPGELPAENSLTDGAKSFVKEGLESALLASSYDAYKEFRKIFNQAFNHGYTDRKEAFGVQAKAHLAKLLSDITSPTIDAVSLCKQFSIPLMASVIGIGALRYSDLLTIADCSKLLADGHGMQEGGDSVEHLGALHNTIVDLVKRVIDENAVPSDSALGNLLQTMDVDTAIGHARAFILGGIDTGSSSLMFSTYLLANDQIQRAEFLKLSPVEQRHAITELISKEAPAYYSPRFALRDVVIDGIEIPAGSFVQLATYAINRCANPGLDIKRYSSGCPVTAKETLPFGHARHKCPGEELGRHFTAVFLDGLFRRFPSVQVVSVTKQTSSFSRGLSELILLAET
jgi:cytochrome P450